MEENKKNTEELNSNENIQAPEKNMTETQVQEEQTEEKSVEEKLTDELSQEKDKSLRLFAEFENYKKRTAKERIELFKSANENLLQDLLPVLDDFERGMEQIEKFEDKDFVKGVELIQHKLLETLKNKGLEVIDVKSGDDFNVDLHEAITQIPAPSEDMKGKIIDTIETGYYLNGKVIRYAKVVVGK